MLLFQDECSFYRQPTMAWLWSWMGRRQPKVAYANKTNTRMRVVGYLNAASGALHSCDMESVTAACLARSVAQLSSWYPEAKKIYLAWDNWPNHHSKTVRQALASQPRVEVLYLPTYAPWLNPIEKVWKQLRQHVTHAHPWAEDFHQLRQHVHAGLDHLDHHRSDLLKTTGLAT